MSKNLELKVKVGNFEDILQNVVFLDAKKRDTLYQLDTYFLTGNKRLKMRNARDESQLIYYLRSNMEESKLSRYYLFKFTNRQAMMVEKILRTFFNVKAVISKKRTLFIYKNTRIHLDEVDNLGNFLELETVFKKNGSQSNFYNEHQLVINALGLHKYKKIKSSYSDHIYDKKF